MRPVRRASPRPFRALGLAGVAATLLASCTVQQPRLPADAVPPEGPAPTIAALTQHIEDLDRSLPTFRAQARVRYEGPQEKFRSSQMIAVASPDRVRIDVMNPFGVSYTLTSDGSLMQAFDRRESRLYEGRASAANVARLAGVPIDMANLAALVRGLPPQLATRDKGQVFPGDRVWLWRRALSGGGKLDVAFEPETLNLQAVRVSGGPWSGQFDAAFSDYRDADGVPVARRMDVAFRDGAQLDLIYERVWPAVPLGDATFAINVPQSVERVKLDD